MSAARRQAEPGQNRRPAHRPDRSHPGCPAPPPAHQEGDRLRGPQRRPRLGHADRAGRPGLTEQVSHGTVILGPNRAGVLATVDKYAALSSTVWTHRHGSGATATFACYDQIWTSPHLPVAAAHVMRRTQIIGDGSDHDPTLIDLDL
jgi:hypothetical protein